MSKLVNRKNAQSMAKHFKPVGKTQLLSHAVGRAIEDSIRGGQLLPGMRMPPEFQLCEQFGVSRTVLREALRMLSGRGLLRIEKGRGIFVSELTTETVTIPMELYLHQKFGSLNWLNVIRARQIIEPPIAAEAALHRTSEDIDRLEQDFRELKDCESGSGDLTALDMAFHLHIAEASGNPILPLLIQPIHALMPRIKASVHQVVIDAKESAIEWHGKILQAIAAGTADEARLCMARHLDVSEDHVRQVMEVEAVENGQPEELAATAS